MGFFSSFFKPRGSATAAKKRLQLVLMHDRSDISPEVMQNLQNDILEAIARYMEIDAARTQIRVKTDAKAAALELSVPVVGMRRGTSPSRPAPRSARREGKRKNVQ